MKQVTGYSAAQIGLHWAVAVLVAAQYFFNDAISEAWDAWTAGRDVAFDPLVAAHVAAGILILVLVLCVLALRRSRGVPPPPENEPARLKALSHVVHWTIYGLLIAMPITGGLAWFADVRPAAETHEMFQVALLAVVALHILAIPFHRFVLKNNIVLRMIRPGP